MKTSFFTILTFLSLTCNISEINSTADAWRTDDEVMALYEEWMQEHEKVYNGLGEKIEKFQVFKENLRYIEKHNSNPNKTYELGLNQFSDLTDEEFESIYLSSSPIDIHNNNDDDDDEMDNESYYLPDEVNSSSPLPASIDWRAKGAVVPIKYQGKCGSCWAFTTIASVEAINKIKSGKLISLSEQMLVDCVAANNGCKSGRLPDAFRFIQRYGVASTKDYPYKGVKGKCQKKNAVVKIRGFKFLSPSSEGGLLRAVAAQVASVGIKAGKEFRQYKSGIFSGKCGDRLNHGVNVVGYGSENGKKFWILRNSWSKKWGEKGYMRIARDVKGHKRGYCGIAAETSFPIMSADEELLTIL